MKILAIIGIVASLGFSAWYTLLLMFDGRISTEEFAPVAFGYAAFMSIILVIVLAQPSRKKPINPYGYDPNF